MESYERHIGKIEKEMEALKRSLRNVTETALQIHEEASKPLEAYVAEVARLKQENRILKEMVDAKFAS
jgi:chromosome segregation ATPase